MRIDRVVAGKDFRFWEPRACEIGTTAPGWNAMPSENLRLDNIRSYTVGVVQKPVIYISTAEKGLRCQQKSAED